MNLLGVKKFIQQVVFETKKITWPTRSDVIISSIIALILCAFFAIFLFSIDQMVILFLKVIFRVN